MVLGLLERRGIRVLIGRYDRGAWKAMVFKKVSAFSKIPMLLAILWTCMIGRWMMMTIISVACNGLSMSSSYVYDSMTGHDDIDNKCMQLIF